MGVSRAAKNPNVGLSAGQAEELAATMRQLLISLHRTLGNAAGLVAARRMMREVAEVEAAVWGDEFAAEMMYAAGDHLVDPAPSEAPGRRR